MTTQQKNKIIGALQAQIDSSGDKELYLLSDNDLTTGTYLDIAFKAAGHTANPEAVINQQNLWNLKVSELAKFLTAP